MDLHADIHAMIRNYMDPYEFRRALNSALQDARSVTFLLQKRKAQLSDFEEWYPKWCESVDSDPVMRWAVKSRNRIVKEEDLALASSLQIEHRHDWLTASDTVLSEDPMFSLEEIAETLVQISAGHASGILTVRRQWIDEDTSPNELVETMVRVFAVLSEVIRQAHKARGQANCDPGVRGSFPCSDQTALGFLPCVSDSRWTRVTVDLADGSLFEWEARTVSIDPADSHAAGSKYEVDPLPSLDAYELVDHLMDAASRVLRVDEFHGPFAFLTRGAERVRVVPMPIASKSELMLRMEELAREARLLGADGILHVGEMWVGAMDEILAAHLAGVTPGDTASPFYGSDFLPGRAEALAVSAMQADGRRRFLHRMFFRHPDGIELGAIEDQTDGLAPNFLIPFVRLWGLATS